MAGPLESMIAIEARPLVAAQQPEASARSTARQRVGLLYLVVILGVFAKWAFEVAGAYIDNSSAAPTFPGTGAIIARAVIAVIVSAVIFPSVYTKLDTATGDTRMVYFVAFQNGFFWQSLLDAVTGDFAVPAE